MFQVMKEFDPACLDCFGKLRFASVLHYSLELWYRIENHLLLDPLKAIFGCSAIK